MTRQVYNPYLPAYEYIPDGEPHVFGDRLYIYGSHDRFDGNKFCLNDYVCYSTPVDDLGAWRYEGIIYQKSEDPRVAGGGHEYWAPDVIQGKDGRYYLYYCPDDSIRSIGVAVCDKPAGQYHFLGIVHDENGNNIGEREGDTIQFDPGVFMDSDGTIYLYSGNGPRTKGQIGKEPKASVVMTLDEDMVTIKTEPKKMLPVLGDDAGSFAGHEFFEASSIRKIGDKYYLVYSSVSCHELCYAISNRPDGGWTYGGVIISNADVFEGQTLKDGKCIFGNNHGGIECVNGKYYIFYHRQTNRICFSRQGCAEEIQILADGSIPQVHLTSQGLLGHAFLKKGVYPASICCNLYGKAGSTWSNRLAMGNRYAYITQSGADYDPEDAGKPPYQYVTNFKHNMTMGFKYFAVKDLSYIGITVRGKARGKIEIRTKEKGKVIATIVLQASKDWQTFEMPVTLSEKEYGLFFIYVGGGKCDVKEIILG